ncbi:hypothetical protein DL96DRAFT_1643617 [Flagelloscypha sp. PMI_526]|nr:hypothetical protein DL96DRAFT_1643617 [Flagelloscypha sp. PMI_526]
MRRILYNQPDFANQKSQLEILCELRGYKVLFLPKFHCELNFIEQVWGMSNQLWKKSHLSQCGVLPRVPFDLWMHMRRD